MQAAAPTHTEKFIIKTIPPAHAVRRSPYPLTSANAYPPSSTSSDDHDHESHKPSDFKQPGADVPPLLDVKRQTAMMNSETPGGFRSFKT
jgi:hypothetical protein